MTVMMHTENGGFDILYGLFPGAQLANNGSPPGQRHRGRETEDKYACRLIDVRQ
jgi:hypothetical protein